MVDKFISEENPKLQIEEDVFSPGVDSTVLIREKTKWSQRERTFVKKKERL